MDDALAAEYLAAQAEQERALAAVEQARRELEDARGEYAAAQSAQASGEQQMQRAAEQLTAGLAALHVDEQALVVDTSLVEYHANVGCYNCYLVAGKEVADVEAGMLSVRVTFPAVELVKRVAPASEAPVVVWRTTIERDVDEDTCSVERKMDHLYLRLPLKQTAKQPLGGLSSFSRVAPEELESESYASVRCRSCDSQMLRPGDASGDAHRDAHRFDKVLPLPSTNWMDMFDFWGSGIGAFEHIPRDGILAHRRRIFVGEADIMVHQADLSPSATTSVPVFKAVSGASGTGGEDAQEEEQWQTVFCSHCRAVIGLASAENPDTVRLHKHMIAASSALESSASRDIFSRYTIDSILSAKLLELADSDGIFHYRLAPLRDSASFVAPPSVFGPVPPAPPPYQLQLLSWETMVRDEHSPAFRRVLKVLFAPVAAESDASKPTKASHSLSHNHPHDHSQLPPLPTHEVALAPETLRIIIKRLDKSSKLLPPSLQTFSDKRVGYLFA